MIHNHTFSNLPLSAPFGSGSIFDKVRKLQDCNQCLDDDDDGDNDDDDDDDSDMPGKQENNLSNVQWLDAPVRFCPPKGDTRNPQVRRFS